jgi:hypothetical protein
MFDIISIGDATIDTFLFVHDIEIKNNLAAYPPLPIPIAYWLEQKNYYTRSVCADKERGYRFKSISLFLFKPST